MLGTEILFYKMLFNVVNLEILLAKYFFKSDFVFVRLINKLQLFYLPFLLHSEFEVSVLRRQNI